MSRIKPLNGLLQQFESLSNVNKPKIKINFFKIFDIRYNDY